jgi:hypothetical protein
MKRAVRFPFLLVVMVFLYCPGQSEAQVRKRDPALSRLTGTWKVECTDTGPMSVSAGAFSQTTSSCMDNSVTEVADAPDGKVTLILRLGGRVLVRQYDLALKRGDKPMKYLLTVEGQTFYPSRQEKKTLLVSLPLTYSEEGGFASQPSGEDRCTIRFDKAAQSVWEIRAAGREIRIELKRNP